MRLFPKTGRSHQLRVHMKEIGHPILGDPFYSENSEAYPRMMLHAQSLKLRHPEGGRGIEFKAKTPF
jgi:tRNA pseudouridine32 synthase/23S rRNA pseudouridine746 synthase